MGAGIAQVAFLSFIQVSRLTRDIIQFRLGCSSNGSQSDTGGYFRGRFKEVVCQDRRKHQTSGQEGA